MISSYNPCLPNTKIIIKTTTAAQLIGARETPDKFDEQTNVPKNGKCKV